MLARLLLRMACTLARQLAALTLLASALSVPLDAAAWGTEGHRLVAEFAERHLSAQARAEVGRLLALEPGSTLASISTWADSERDASTAAWHYVNFARDSGCRYEPARDCPEGNCVVGAIEQQARVLGSNAPDEARLKALKLLVHLVADAHQPLHGGFADDRGGNYFQIEAAGFGTNLHALWDAGLIDDWPGGSRALRRAMLNADRFNAVASTFGAWVEESCAIVTSPGFYPGKHELDPGYPERWNATVVRRLVVASRRLARLLDDRLSGR